MNRNLVGSTYGRFCIKFPQSRIKGEQHRLIPLSQELPVAAMFVNRSDIKWAFFIEDLPMMLPTKFHFIWLRGLKGED
jgi:hypothetical protein